MQNSEAFISGLYRREDKKIFDAAYRMTGDRDLSLDLVQDTFLLALSHQQELTAHPKPGAWLMTTLRNLVKNKRRLSSSAQISFDELMEQGSGEPERPLLELLPAQLSENEKNILIWRFEQRKDYRDIGQRLGISETGSRSRVFRILAKCKKYLKK